MRNGEYRDEAAGDGTGLHTRRRRLLAAYGRSVVARHVLAERRMRRCSQRERQRFVFPDMGRYLDIENRIGVRARNCGAVQFIGCCGAV